MDWREEDKGRGEREGCFASGERRGKERERELCGVKERKQPKKSSEKTEVHT